jgi:hypothetical protein
MAVELLIVIPAACLGWGLAGSALWVAVWSRRVLGRRERDLHEARTRAALAESALHDLRARRSAAVAAGNKTRGQKQAELRKAMLGELQAAVTLRKAGGQHALPLDAGAAGPASVGVARQ